MCGILDIAPRDSILRAEVEDIAFLEVGDALEDDSCFRIFGSKASRYASSMKEPPRLCFVVILAFS